MARISQMLGAEHSTSYIGVNPTNKQKESGERVSKKEAPEEKERVDRKELEHAYFKSGLAFNSTNKSVQTILSSQPKLVHEDDTVVNFFKDFLDSVGQIGGNESWEEIREKIFRYQCIYGNAYIELIPKKSGDEIIDLACIDPKRMEYAKDGHGNVVVDKYSNPVGYVQEVKGTLNLENKITPPDEVGVGANKIYIPAERVAHYKLYTVGDGYYGIGLYEPAYQEMRASLNLEKDYEEKAYSTLFPLRYAEVGDINHEPTPEKLNHIKNILQDAKYSSEMALPYHVDLDLLEAKHPEALREFLEYFNDKLVASTGVPKPFATGRGESSNKATIAKQNQLFELTLKDITKRTTRTTEKQIFKRIAEKSNKVDDWPDYEWGPIGVEEVDMKATRLLEYAKAGILSKEEVRDIIENLEELSSLRRGD